MLYLIGGGPRCGKTTLAEKLSKKMNVGWMPADYLTVVIWQYMSDAAFKKDFPLSHKRHTTHPLNDAFFDDFSAKEIVAMYRKQAKSVWKGLAEFLGYAAFENRDFIIEGYQLDPLLVAALPKTTLSKLRVVYLGRTDTDAIQKGFSKSTEERDWVLDHTKNPETLDSIARMISTYSSAIEKDAAKKHLPYVNLDKNFEKGISAAMNLLLS